MREMTRKVGDSSFSDGGSLRGVIPVGGQKERRASFPEVVL